MSKNRIRPVTNEVAKDDANCAADAMPSTFFIFLLDDR